MKHNTLLALLLAALLLGTIPAGLAQDADAAVGTVTDEASADAAGDTLSAAVEDGELDRAAVKEAITKAYVAKKLNRAHVRRLLARMYARRALKRADLRWLLVNSYKEGKLTRDDVRELIFNMYKEKRLKRADVRWLIVHAYKNNELTRDDVREMLGAAHKAGVLTKEDLKWLVVSAYKAGELKRSDLMELAGAMYKNGHLARADLKWLIINSYKAGELRRSDVRFMIAKAHKLGHLKRADVRWILVQAHKAGELESGDIHWILKNAIAQGEMTKEDATGIITEAVDAGELTVEDVDAEEVVAEAEKVVAVEEEDEPFTNDASVVAFLAVKGRLLEMDILARAMIAFHRSKGRDVTPLVEKRTAFIDVVQELEDAAQDDDKELVKTKGAAVKAAAVAFQQANKGMLQQGDKVNLAMFMLKHRNKYKPEIDELKKAVAMQVAARRLAAFDRHVKRAELMVAKAKAEGIDTSAVDPKLAEVKAARAAVTVAFNSGKKTEIAKAARDAKRKGAELKRVFEREARKAMATKFLAQTEVASAKVHGFLDAADEQGIDTAKERIRLEKIDADVAKARANLEAGKYGMTLGNLRAANHRFHALKRGMKARALFGKRGAIRAYVKKVRHPLLRLKRAAAALEKNGVDISAEKDQAEQVKTLLDSAGEKVKAEDYDGALEDAKKARETFNAMRSSLIEKVKTLKASKATEGGA